MCGLILYSLEPIPAAKPGSDEAKSSACAASQTPDGYAPSTCHALGRSIYRRGNGNEIPPGRLPRQIDGGSRGNPGPASYGVVVRNERGEIVAKLKKYIGRMTNNVAEYYGLIAALDYAQSNGVRALRIESDSELLVRQMRGHYKVKSADLRPLFERAKKMALTFESFRIDHVYRAQNSEADALANEALDETAGRSKAAGSDAKERFAGGSAAQAAGALPQRRSAAGGAAGFAGKYRSGNSAAAPTEALVIADYFRE